jgi:hypothetical protein
MVPLKYCLEIVNSAKRPDVLLGFATHDGLSMVARKSYAHSSDVNVVEITSRSIRALTWAVDTAQEAAEMAGKNNCDCSDNF